MKLLLFAVTFTLAALPVQACFAPKDHQVYSPEELVAKTDNIYLATVKSNQKRPPFLGGPPLSEAVFEINETLKGKSVNKTIRINGFEKVKNSPEDFNGHKDKEFWDTRSAGSASITPACKIIPYFKVKEQYLIFEGADHFKAYEMIRSKDDLWLKKVKETITALK